MRTTPTRIAASVSFVLCFSLPIGNVLAQPVPVPPLGEPEVYSRAIVLHGSKEQRDRIRKDLASLAALPTGKKLLAAIEAAATGSKTVTIIYLPGAASASPTRRSDAVPRRHEKQGDLIEILEPGPGSSSIVFYDPDIKETNKNLPAPGGIQCITPELILGHELIHALHNLQGRSLVDIPHVEPGGLKTDYEERVTMGHGGAVDRDGITENAIRRDQGVSERLGYGRLCWLPEPDAPKGKGILGAVK